jgi:hypothetical protein
MYKTILSFLWILVSPITLGLLFPIGIALFVTENRLMIGLNYIAYSGLWYYINEKWIIKKSWYFK